MNAKYKWIKNIKKLRNIAIVIIIVWKVHIEKKNRKVIFLFKNNEDVKLKYISLYRFGRKQFLLFIGAQYQIICE